MKKVAIASLIALSLVGCGRLDNVVNKFESATGMLTRTVTLYDANGQVIKTWTTKNEIQYSGSLAGFIDVNGVNVRVSGTVVIEGK